MISSLFIIATILFPPPSVFSRSFSLAILPLDGALLLFLPRPSFAVSDWYPQYNRRAARAQ
jgi:hypothetical protein